MAAIAEGEAGAAANIFSTAALPKVARGKGSYVWDTNGKQYVDGSGGPSVYCLGHGNEDVNQAIKDQLDQIASHHRFTFSSDALETLQAMVAKQCGGGLKEMVFVTGGSEAVESCLKIALQYHSATGQKTRRRFIARQRSWHGNTLGALSISGFAQRREPFEGSLLEASFVSPANVYRPPAGIAPQDIAEYCAAELEREILRQGPENVAAFIFEPVVGAAGGAVPAPEGYAKAMRAVCDKYGVLMIADEVMCGAGRTGYWRALEEDGVEPDIMSVAKGLGAGYVPLGVAIYHERLKGPIVEAHGDLLTAHTFTGHTLACAAGVAVQQVVERDGLLERVRTKGPQFADALRREIGQHAHIGDIRGRGYFVGVEFVADQDSKEPFDADQMIFAKIKQRGLENGLICYPVGGNVDGKRGDIAILSPAYNATDAELDEIVDKFAQTCRDVLP